MKYFMSSNILDTEKETTNKYKIMTSQIRKNKLQTDQNSSKVVNCSVEIILQPNCCTELHWKTSKSIIRVEPPAKTILRIQ
jgi:negative regulator of sigma E activity